MNGPALKEGQLASELAVAVTGEVVHTAEYWSRAHNISDPFGRHHIVQSNGSLIDAIEAGDAAAAVRARILRFAPEARVIDQANASTELRGMLSDQHLEAKRRANRARRDRNKQERKRKKRNR